MDSILNPTLGKLWVIALLGLLWAPARAEDARSDKPASADSWGTMLAPSSVAHEISQADEVVITEEGERTTYEYWVNGQMRLIRVVPAVGPEYYLYPEDVSHEAGIDQSDPLLVRWRILEF